MSTLGGDALQEPLLNQGIEERSSLSSVPAASRQTSEQQAAGDPLDRQSHRSQDDQGTTRTWEASSLLPLFLLATGSALGLSFRVLLTLTGVTSLLKGRIEVSTPINSWIRLKEGAWLMENGLSPYSTGVFHSSPLLLYLFGSFSEVSFSIIAALLDVTAALLLHRTVILATSPSRAAFSESKRNQNSKSNRRHSSPNPSAAAGVTAALCFLLNPLRIVSSSGATTAPIGDFFLILSLLAAVSRVPPIAAFGWLMTCHFSISRSVLVIPLCLLLAHDGTTETVNSEQCLDSGTEKDPLNAAPTESKGKGTKGVQGSFATVLFKSTAEFACWSLLWGLFLLQVCSMILGIPLPQAAGVLYENAAFEFNTSDLTPNWGLRWYFFSEVFPDVRDFFAFVFASCSLIVLIPLAVRLWKRPLFLAFTLLGFGNLMASSYPSASDYALVISLLPAFAQEMRNMRGGFVVFLGFIYVATMGPIMFDLWCVKGIGNANFYYAVTLIFAASQGLFLVQSVWGQVSYDYETSNMQ